MILPYIGFGKALAIALLAGFIFLYFHPAWKVGLINIIFFVSGGILSLIIAGVICRALFSCPMTGPDSGMQPVMSILLALLSILAGGYAGVSAWQRIVREKMKSGK